MARWAVWLAALYCCVGLCCGIANELAPLVLRALESRTLLPPKMRPAQRLVDRFSGLRRGLVSFIPTHSNSAPTRDSPVSGLWSGVLSWFSFAGKPLQPKKKILILMSDTGGGHRASAQALDQALQDQFPGRLEVEIMDIWTTYGRWPFNQCVPSYRFLAKHPMLWRAFYAYGTFPPTRKLTECWSSVTCGQSFRQAIRASAPDFVVSVHPLCHYIPISIVQEMNVEREAARRPRVPFVTVVTDLADAHATWFDNRVDACFVPSEAVRSLALKNGMATEKILLRGLPIRPAFWHEPQPKPSVRAKLGLHINRKTALLMGGGDGVGGMASIAGAVAESLAAQPFASQLVVICGHNQRIADTLRTKLAAMHNNVSVIVKGFVHNIDEFMAASDCLITKAGPGTIAEAMTRGLPLVLSSFLPGQETGNVPYAVDGGFGVYTGMAPRTIAATVTELFRDEARLLRMSARARAMAHPEATISIAREIGDTVLCLPIKIVR